LWPLQTNSFSSCFTSVSEEARPHEGYWGRNESSKAQNQKRQESFAAARAQVGKLLLQWFFDQQPHHPKQEQESLQNWLKLDTSAGGRSKTRFNLIWWQDQSDYKGCAF